MMAVAGPSAETTSGTHPLLLLPHVGNRFTSPATIAVAPRTRKAWSQRQPSRLPSPSRPRPRSERLPIPSRLPCPLSRTPYPPPRRPVRSRRRRHRRSSISSVHRRHRCRKRWWTPRDGDAGTRKKKSEAPLRLSLSACPPAYRHVSIKPRLPNPVAGRLGVSTNTCVYISHQILRMYSKNASYHPPFFVIHSHDTSLHIYLRDIGSALLRRPFTDVWHAPRTQPSCDVVSDLQRLDRIRNAVNRLHRERTTQSGSKKKKNEKPNRSGQVYSPLPGTKNKKSRRKKTKVIPRSMDRRK